MKRSIFVSALMFILFISCHKNDILFVCEYSVEEFDSVSNEYKVKTVGDPWDKWFRNDGKLQGYVTDYEEKCMKKAQRKYGPSGRVGCGIKK